MKNKAGLYFVIFLLLVMALVIGVALTLPYLESKLLPLLSAGIILQLRFVVK